MRAVRLILVAVLATGAMSLSTIALPAAAAAGATITGHVYDSNGQPLQGVNLLFGMAGPTTAADGSYSITVPTGYYGVIMMPVTSPDGPYTYNEWAIWDVSVTGTMVEDFTLPARVPLNLAVQTAQGQPVPNTAFAGEQSRLDQTMLDGSVVHWNGTPIRPANAPLGTDATGHSSFTALLGSNTMVAAAVSPGTMATHGTVSVPTDPTTATVNLQPLHTLSGTFTSADGSGIASASLSVTSTVDDWASGTTTTNAAGAYSIQGPDDPYNVSVSFTGAPLSGFSGGSDMFTTTMSGDTTLSPSIPAAVPIRVKLQHYDGSPATEASVTGTDSAGTWVRDHYGTTVLPDSSGIATAEALAGTQVTITAADPGQSTVTQTITAPSAATDPNGPPDATILVGPRPAASDVVSGHVLDSNGAAIAGATVQVTSQASSTPTSVTTASDGSWSANVAPGSVTINANTQTTIPNSAPPGSVQATMSVSAQGTVTAPTLVAQDITLPAMHQFTARVVDASGGPVPGVRFMTGPWSGYHQTMSGVDYAVGGFANMGVAASDANGEMTFWALDNSTNTGSTQQADGFVAPMSFHLTTPSDQNTIPMPWFGTVQSQGIDAGTVTITAPPGVTLSQLQATPATTTPDGQTALVGNVSYEVSGIPTGSTQDITLTLPPGTSPTNVFKVDSSGHTSDASSYSTISGNTVILHLTDGGSGDADGVANGVIIDPVLPTHATNATSTPSPTASASPSPTTAPAPTTTASPVTTTVSATGPAYPVKVTAGGAYSFTGVLKAGGQPAHDAVVEVLIRKLGTTTWGVLGSALSDSNGNLSFTVTPTKNCQLMWSFPGAPGFTSSTSAAGLREVDVKPSLSLSVTRPTVRRGSTTTLWGVMTPGMSGQKVVLQKVVNGAASTTAVVATIKLQRLPNGSVAYGFVMPLRPTSRGVVLYRVAMAKTHDFMATSSGGVRVTVS